MRDQIMMDRLIDKKELKELVQYSYSSISRLEKSGNFPQRIRIGLCRVVWSLNEVLHWIEDKKAERQHSYIVDGALK